MPEQPEIKIEASVSRKERRLNITHSRTYLFQSQKKNCLNFYLKKKLKI